MNLYPRLYVERTSTRRRETEHLLPALRRFRVYHLLRWIECQGTAQIAQTHLNISCSSCEHQVTQIHSSQADTNHPPSSPTHPQPHRSSHAVVKHSDVSVLVSPGGISRNLTQPLTKVERYFRHLLMAQLDFVCCYKLHLILSSRPTACA